ncbi:beta-ketoacyl synthase N-terminal-like domain-containing protein [Streptomyces sp. NPDC006678]|uniref:type I polyketide synthase n=1 Tax=Streptomyces sp. NPDC006678 TaxID=3157185 RepID=UPI003406D862
MALGGTGGRAAPGVSGAWEGGYRTVPVAITGMAVLLPGAPDLAAYRRNLEAGVDAIEDVPEGRWDAEFFRPGAATGPHSADHVYCRRGGFVDTLTDVDVTRFGIMPSSVQGTEPDQLIALRVAASAIADAGGEGGLPDRERIGVVLGRGGYLTPGLVRLDQRVRTASQLVRTLGELLPGLDAGQLARVRRAFTERLGPDRPENAIGLVPNLAASRLANRLDLRGPAYTVDAACASSLVAVDQAVGELASGRCDLMLAGGVHHCHDITLWSVFSQLRALSPSQRSRPFHRGADGILIGEGTGVVVLKRLADAERDGDRIYAVIRGTAVSSDGRTAGLVSPDPGGQIRAVRQAWRAAGLDPAAPGSIGLLEAHGTATPAGDAAELRTLAEVFGPPDGRDGAPAVIGSVKSMIGHAMPAAGVAGLVKAALALHHATLLPTLHCDDPHPALAETRFRTVARAETWETVAGGPPRRAAVNAFGFGGINAHVVLEQAPDAVPFAAGPSAPPYGPARRTAVLSVAERERVLLLATDGPQDMAALLGADDAAVLDAGLDADAARTAGRTRLGIVGPTADRLRLARRIAARGRAWHGRNDVWFAPEPLLGGERPGRIAFVFPGLESDFEPRVADVAEHFGLVPPGPALGAGGAEGGSAGAEGSHAEADVGDIGAEVGGIGAEVGDIGRHGLGVVAVGRLLDTALRRLGVVPEAVAGHSIGEWTAMAAAGLYAEQAVDDFMASLDPDAVTVPDLAFAAVGASAERVGAALGEAGLPVTLSHDNAPGQSMVCGPPDAVESFARSLRARGVLCRVLPFRSGFHTPMLAPCLGPFRAAAERFELHRPSVPVWSGTTAAPFPRDEAGIRELFVRHLLEPVRFRQLTEALYEAGFRAFVQVGTGQLGSLIGDTLSGREHLVVAANSPHRSGLAQLRRVAVALWTEGAPVEPDVIDRPGVTGGAARPGASGASAELRPRAAGPDQSDQGKSDQGRSEERDSPKGPPVRLDLSGALISLDPDALAGLRASLHPGVTSPSAPVPAVAPAAPPGADRFPVLAELTALMQETATTAAELIAAAALPGTPAGASGHTTHGGGAPGTTRTAPPQHDRPAPVPPSATAPVSSGTAAGADAPVAAPAPAPGNPPPANGTSPGNGASPDAPPGRTVGPAAGRPAGSLRVATDTMPYLLDHCFFRQRPGWPSVADRWPVVPATTIVHHLMEAAERSAPGMRAVAVHDARFDRWLAASEPVDVAVAVTPAGPDRVSVTFGPYARAVVELAARHAPPPAGLGSEAFPDEHVPVHTAAQLYDERWMFHGPAYQGVTTLTGIGARHVRAVLTTPSAPGALLDNVGQVLGYWIMATATERTVVFPVRMRHLRFYGPPPRPGTRLECLVRVTSLTGALLEADVLLTCGGTVWARLTGWQDRRFDNDPQTRPVERFPERNTLSVARTGGWSLLHERWPDLASRELVMRNMLGGDERTAYERHPPRGRRQWLLGRIAAKDAVRHWLWRQGAGPVFPAELRVDNDELGRPLVTGLHGLDLPPLAVSIAHRAESAVAIVRPREAAGGTDEGAAGPQAGPGIDIEEIAEPAEATVTTALGGEERALLTACGAADGDSLAVWFTRFWAAKEAAAKAEGTGFGGRPKDFAVVEAARDRLTVEARTTVAGRPSARTYRIRCEQVATPPGLPARSYVVAWTGGPGQDNDKEEDGK